MYLENLMDTAKENQGTIFTALGVLVAAFLGKKYVDSRKNKEGSSSYMFPVPNDGSMMGETEAFFAFKQRSDGSYAKDPYSDSRLNRMEWMRKYHGSYDASVHGKSGVAQEEWRKWSESIPGRSFADDNQWEPSSASAGLFDDAFHGTNIDVEDQGEWNPSSRGSSLSSSFYPVVPDLP